MRGFPLIIGHAIDDLSRLFPAERSVSFCNPIGKAVAAEAGQAHQIHILHIRSMLQMFDQAAESRCGDGIITYRSEEHTSELQSLMRISYDVFCLKNKTTKYTTQRQIINITLHRN